MGSKKKNFNLQFAFFAKKNAFFFSRPKALTELNRYLVVYLAVYLTFGSTYASILA